MRILIFDNEVEGHHLEYMHHLHEALANTRHEIIFLTARKHEEVRNKLEWTYASNISLVYLEDKEQKLCDSFSLLRSAWYKSKIIRKYVKCYDINAVWLITFIHLMPFLPFFLPQKVKISGILYRIYLYNQSISSFRLMLEKLRFWIMAIARNVDHIFVLNDHHAAKELNTIYHTDKFHFLPDPFMQPDLADVANIKANYCSNSSQKMWIHFGALEERKGTLDILKAIAKQTPEQAINNVFVIAGRVFPEMKDDFYNLLENHPYRKQIYVHDEFCSYSFLYSLCFSCDAILIPYHNIIQSSGVIGYASFFEKPVVGPGTGLLGDIIKEYELGVTLDNITPETLYRVFKMELPLAKPTYVHMHTPSDFTKVLLSELINDET